MAKQVTNFEELAAALAQQKKSDTPQPTITQEVAKGEIKSMKVKEFKPFNTRDYTNLLEWIRDQPGCTELDPPPADAGKTPFSYFLVFVTPDDIFDSSTKIRLMSYTENREVMGGSFFYITRKAYDSTERFRR